MGSAAVRGAEQSGPVISGVKALTAAQRATLARGGRVQLTLKVSDAATVSATGTARGKQVISSSVKVKSAGSVGVPLKLSKAGVSELAEGNSLRVKLVIASDAKAEKTLTLVLKPAGKKRKGGPS